MNRLRYRCLWSDKVGDLQTIIVERSQGSDCKDLHRSSESFEKRLKRLRSAKQADRSKRVVELDLDSMRAKRQRNEKRFAREKVGAHYNQT